MRLDGCFTYVARGRETNTARSDGEWEDLADDNPGARSPCGSENTNVQTDKSDHGLGSVGVGRVVDGVLSSGGTDSTNDELHDDHAAGTVNE